MTGQQMDMLTPDGKPLPRVDQRIEPAERQRLHGQCLAILERLRRGQASNAELAELALKYTSRISDLRAVGYRIEIVARDRGTGRVVYQLMESRK